jgi:hypothetical protein
MFEMGIHAVKTSSELAANEADVKQAVDCVDRVSIVHVLVVKDSLPSRQFLDSILAATDDFQVIRGTREELEATRKAEELQPGLILFNIKLSTLDGLRADLQKKAARRKNSTQNEAKSVLYGLPCADCHAYYDSNITECPVCHSTQRITPSTAFGAISRLTF